MDPVIQLLVSRYGMTPTAAAEYVRQLRGGVQGEGTLIDRFDREALNDIVVPQTMQQMQQVGPAAWMGYWKEMQKSESQRKHDMAKRRFAEQDRGTGIIERQARGGSYEVPGADGRGGEGFSLSQDGKVDDQAIRARDLSAVNAMVDADERARMKKAKK